MLRDLILSRYDLSVQPILISSHTVHCKNSSQCYWLLPLLCASTRLHSWSSIPLFFSSSWNSTPLPKMFLAFYLRSSYMYSRTLFLKLHYIVRCRYSSIFAIPILSNSSHMLHERGTPILYHPVSPWNAINKLFFPSTVMHTISMKPCTFPILAKQNRSCHIFWQSA